MSFPYTTPTGLAGVPASLSIPLTWNPSSLISAAAVLLISGNKPAGSTSFTDDSGTGNVITTLSPAVATASDPLFGNNTISLPSSPAGLTTPIAAAGPLDLSVPGSWTVEGWLFAASLAVPTIFFQMGDFTGGNGFVIQTTPTGLLTGQIRDVGGADVTFTTVAAMALSTWTHFALVNNAGVITCYVNGQGGGPQTLLGPIPAYTSIARVGADFGSNAGKIAEVRITSGSALYTGDFTPPTAPFMGTVPSGYDVYRNGVSVAQYLGAPGYTDSVPGPGIYTYNVAASDGVATDVSDLSAPLIVAIGQISGLQAKFVPALAFKAAMVANPGLINPRIYPPLEDYTVRITP